jgi:hypothetical protein
MRDSMQHVSFSKGYSWATDGHILIRQSLTNFHGFTPEDAEKLNGKMIHCNIFKEIIKYDFITVNEDHIEVNNNGLMRFYFKDAEGLPNFTDVINKSVEVREKVSEIGLNIKYLSLVEKIIKPTIGHSRLIFTKVNKAIFVSANSDSEEIKDNFGLVMPAMITGEKDLKTLKG